MFTRSLHVVPTLCSLLLIPLMSFAQPAHQEVLPDSGFRALASDWLAAYNSGDSTRLAAFYTKDAQYVSPHVQGYVLRGRDAIVANFLTGARAGGHIDSITVLSCSITEQMVTIVCRYDATNSGVSVNGRNVIVLRKVDNRWLYAVHASIIRD